MNNNNSIVDEGQLLSCVQSLVSSADDLYDLASDVYKFYIKLILSHKCAIKNSSSKSLSSLAVLQNVADFHDKALATLETTLKRFKYHQSKQICHKAIFCILGAISELLAAFINLEQLIKVNVDEFDLSLFRKRPQADIDNEKHTKLVEFVDLLEIKLLSDTSGLFMLCLKRIQAANIANLSNYLEDFIFLNTMPSAATHRGHLNAARLTLIQILNKFDPSDSLCQDTASKRLLKLVAIFVLHSKVTTSKSINSRLVRNVVSTCRHVAPTGIVPLPASNCFLFLDKFFANHLKSNILAGNNIDLNEFINKSLQEEFDTFALRSIQWRANLDKLEDHIDEDDCEDYSKSKSKSKNQLGSINDPASRQNNQEISEFTKQNEKYIKQIKLFKHGIELAESVLNLVKSHKYAHQFYDKPIPKQKLIFIIKLVALVKSIQSQIDANKVYIFDKCTTVNELSFHIINSVLNSLRNRVILADNKKQQPPLDVTSVVVITSICSNININATCRELLILSTCLPTLVQLMSLQELTSLNFLLDLNELNLVGAIRSNNLHFDCSFLHSSISSNAAVYYTHCFEDNTPASIYELSLFHLALNDIRQLFTIEQLNNYRKQEDTDASNLFARIKFGAKVDDYLAELGSSFVETFKTKYLNRICQELEIELRLQTAQQQLQNSDEFEATSLKSVYNFNFIFAPNAPKTFEIFGNVILLHHHVEQYLNRVCYNLTSITPNDWHSYDNMLCLANEQFGLEFASSQLPTRQNDSGLDLLELACNFNIFVAHYSYDLPNQMFIEKCYNRISSSGSSSIFSMTTAAMPAPSFPMTSNKQMLNTVQIAHVSRNIQTYGLGVLGSAINSSYQHTKRLVGLFCRLISQKSFQTMIYELKSSSCGLASKDRNVKGNGRSRYVDFPHYDYQDKDEDEADNEDLVKRLNFDEVNRVARKHRLSVNGGGGSAGFCNTTAATTATTGDLDSLRQIITQLGNCLAFVRLLKSGALDRVSQSADYVPDLDDLANFRLGAITREFCGGSGSASGTATGFNQIIVDAAELLDECLENLNETLASRANYLNIMVKLFSKLMAARLACSAAAREPSANATQPDLANNENGTQARDTSVKGAPNDAAYDQSKAKCSTTTTAATEAQQLNLRSNLAAFYVVVPALTLNFIDYVTNCKERLMSRSESGRVGALLSDDGFAVGLAFVLTILPHDQASCFANLDWFECVAERLGDERDSVGKLIASAECEETLRRASQMTAKRLDTILDEFQTLCHTLSSALMLFKAAEFEAVDEFGQVVCSDDEMYASVD